MAVENDTVAEGKMAADAVDTDKLAADKPVVVVVFVVVVVEVEVVVVVE